MDITERTKPYISAISSKSRRDEMKQNHGK